MKEPQFKGSIRRQLIVMIVLLVTVTGGTGYTLFLYWFMSSQQQSTHDQAETVARVLSQDFARLQLLNDVTVAADISAKLTSFPELVSMVLFNSGGQAIYQYQRHQHNQPYISAPDHQVQFRLPATYQGTALGEVDIVFQAASLSEILKRDSPAVVLIGLLMLIASYLLAFSVEKRFSGPLLKLVQFLEQISNRHQLTQRISTDQNNEFGKLYWEVNTMLERLDLSLSQQKSAEAKLEYLSLHDPLTGLGNRKLLLDTLEQARLYKSAGALLCFDLNNFKLVNDSFGHETGDHLLLQVAHRMRKDFKDAQLLVRLGGDEFALWFDNLSSAAPLAALEAENLAERILEQLNYPFYLNDRDISCSASVGIAISTPMEPVLPVQLIQQADAALHQAKRDDHTHITFYDARAEQVAREYIELHTALRQALREQEFQLYYQPQTLANGRVTGAEALIRWQRPGHGLISPLSFIPAAERSGLILPLGEWVLQEACRTLRHWQASPATRSLTLSINVSTRQFYQDDFIYQVAQALQISQANPRQLKLELTESLLVEDLDKVVDTMKALADLGVQISLDDFGTGYSSLQYLQRLPLHQIKVDQSFIRELLTQNSKDTAIVRTLLSLGEAFGYEVLAEGVETSEQLDFLCQLGYTGFQGYYFSPPLPLNQFEAYCLRQTG